MADQTGEKIDILGTLEVELDRGSAEKAVDELKRKLQGSGSVPVRAEAASGPSTDGGVSRGTGWTRVAPKADQPSPFTASEQAGFIKAQRAKLQSDAAQLLSSKARGAAPPMTAEGAASGAARAGMGRAAIGGLAVAGGAAAAAGAVVALVTAAAAAAYKIYRAGQRVAENEVARGAAYSPAIRTVQILEELRVRQREIVRGSILAPSLNSQRQATQNLYDAIARATTPVERWINEASASFNNSLTNGLNYLLDQLGFAQNAPANMIAANKPFADYFYAVTSPARRGAAPVVRPALPAPYVSPNRRQRP